MLDEILISVAENFTGFFLCVSYKNKRLCFFHCVYSLLK